MSILNSISVLALVLISTIGYSQDLIFRKNNESFEGQVKEIAEDTITYLPAGSRSIAKLAVTDLSHIRFKNGKIERFEPKIIAQQSAPEFQRYVQTKRSYVNGYIAFTAGFSNNPLESAYDGVKVGTSSGAASAIEFGYHLANNWGIRVQYGGFIHSLPNLYPNKSYWKIVFRGLTYIQIGPQYAIPLGNNAQLLVHATVGPAINNITPIVSLFYFADSETPHGLGYAFGCTFRLPLDSRISFHPGIQYNNSLFMNQYQEIGAFNYTLGIGIGLR